MPKEMNRKGSGWLGFWLCLVLLKMNVLSSYEACQHGAGPIILALAELAATCM
eukprot:CAMPEP_0185781790 /NCGR_PEP_ID=MMETSP1174-20130828/104041_1 /TAXON_ID=35687 /ORGANISM="Dictyocha speculum, Strain CCMP1381" /LENGTH=52 /DNA_ID=CAMNT_0028471923 /DNA_START=231 /DNA_END=386 /DNA_ORIENTATION=+